MSDYGHLGSRAPWNYEDEERANRQGWEIVYGAIYKTPPLPSEEVFMPTCWDTANLQTNERIGWWRVLENSLGGCPTALKAMEAIVETNPDYAEFKKTYLELTSCHSEK